VAVQVGATERGHRRMVAAGARTPSGTLRP
jgi:hypothetical protein